MTSISSISELFNLSQSQYRVYDLGRRVTKIAKTEFSKIENNQTPYPFPSQGHAFFALSFWQKKTQQTYLWFLKIPLDERGLLNLGARNHFIAIIMEALGSDLSADPTERQAELLKNNPYLFTPPQYKLANLNSLISHELKEAPSEYYQSAKTYLNGDLGWEQWHNIGVQGLTDFSVRLDDKSKQQALIKALPHLPEEVLTPLCSALENQKLSADLIQALINELSKNSNNDSRKLALLRALSASCEHVYAKDFIKLVIEQYELSIDMMIVLSGRCWEVFTDTSLLMRFLEKLVTIEHPSLFLSVFKDLVAIPTIRPILFTCMRSPQRSPELASAIGKLFTPQ